MAPLSQRRKQLVDQATTLGSVTLSDLATIYGCCGLFDLCSDQDLMSLSFEGQNQFMDWLGWEKTSVCQIKKNFITWTRPESTAQGARSTGYLSNPCGDSHGVDWGGCDFTLEDFALLRRHGPERNATKSRLRLCDAQPRYRLDGTPITNDVEFDMRLATEGLMQDLKTMVIDGNASTPGQFDGLERLIKTGYTNSKGVHCHSMDSTVINWNSNDLGGGNGITWNGAAVANSYSFIDVLMAVVRHIKDRIKLAPALAAQPLSEGNITFVAPSHVLRSILDSFTCWSVCPGATNIQVAIQSYEARRFRDSLMGGQFGDGTITIDGFAIPLCQYDWGLYDTSTGDADAYLLTGNVGNVKTINGQFNDLSMTPADYPEAMYSYTDGGRLLTWLERQKTCIYREVEMQPRLLMWAPWCQARFESLDVDSIGPVIGPNPWVDTFPETSFSAAVCPA